ncbi:MAG: sugar kinase [Kiritimatiellae bacterium]|nr:sugar kinase [Kiritimatiellia bacterium]
MKPLIAGFGEVMLRLSPEGYMRIGQALPGRLCATFGGGETNVCASVAMFGMPSRVLTALPKNAVADALVAQLRGIGADTSRILRTDGGRVGVYFTETGANQRGSTVLYDRANSSIAEAPASAYDFDGMLDGVTWLHLSGITPAISRNACEANLALAQAAAARGVSISLDLNFRKKLWRWESGTEPRALASRCMEPLAALADVLIGNEEDAKDVFGIEAEGSSIEEGKLSLEGYRGVAAALSKRFPKARFVATTLRESHSATWNGWGAMLYDTAAAKAHFAPVAADGSYRPYGIRAIVDRIGGGDSFSAGLVYALNAPKWSEPARAIAFAAAASCLKHTIHGDFNYVSVAEVEALAAGNASGRVSR